MPSKSMPLTDISYSNGERQSLLSRNSSLKQLYEDNQLTAFNTKLQMSSGRDQEFLDVLHIAMRDTNSESAFLDLIVQKLDASDGVATPDLRTAALDAAKAGNLAALRLLLRDATLAVRRLEAQDELGTTPLHAAVIAAVAEDADALRLDCVALLLEKHRECSVDLRGLDTSDRTALYIAAQFGTLELARKFLEHNLIGLDIPCGKVAGEVMTPRTWLLGRFPGLKTDLEKKPLDADLMLRDHLHQLLEQGDAKSLEFCEKVSACAGDASELRHPRGGLSLMQQACFRGRADAVDALLAKAPALSATPANAANRTAPLLCAVQCAKADVVDVFAFLPEENGKKKFRPDAAKRFEERSLTNDDTVLILLVRHWKDEESYHACLEKLLSDEYRELVDVNATNKDGDSALHLAALCRNTRVSLALLAAGAYIAGKNARGWTPLDHLPAATLQTHLDACVTVQGDLSSDDRAIFFEYAFLRAPPQRATSTQTSTTPGDGEKQGGGDLPRRETKALAAVSRSKEMRRLLKHPVLNSFLDHKWKQMQMIFYFNAVLYFLFVIFITCHILEQGRDSDPREKSIMFFLAIVGFGYLLLRELVQLLMDPCRYFRQLENYLEGLLLLCAGMALAQWPLGTGPLHRVFPALTVLLAWGEFVLLLGRHPRCATNVEMLKTVTLNFLKFLVWFAGLIIAFTLCFYTLFRDEPSAENFSNLPLSWFKTFVMMTGELDLDNVPLDGLPLISRPIFAVYVFLVVIVLLNLLNGLAVSDTQAIKDDAELVCCVSRVSMAERVESKLFHWLRLTQRHCPCLAHVAACMVRKAAAVKSANEPQRGWLHPNAECVLRIGDVSPMLLPTPLCCLSGPLGFGCCHRIGGKIVKRAEEVLAARGAISELADLEERLIRRIDEVGKKREARLVQQVEAAVASAIQAALAQRTTQQ